MTLSATRPAITHLQHAHSWPRSLTLLVLLFLTGWHSITFTRSSPLYAGPLLHTFPLTLSEGTRTEALGPLYSHQQSDLWEQWAISPFLSYTRDHSIDAKQWDFVYPLITYDRFGKEYALRFFLLLNFAGGQNQAENLQRRITLFPVFFSQSSPDPELRYLALFPLGGHLQNRFNRDEIRFLLFPLFARTRKADVITHNYLYPLFHLRRGDNLHGWQLWPLVGLEKRTAFTRTDDFGDPVLVPGHRKTFALWPLYFNQHLNLGSTNPTTYQILFPFYALQRSPARDSSTWLWPLFTYTNDRERKYREWAAPWPLIVFARGEGKNVNRVWPLFSRASSPILQSDFYLWPLYKFNRIHSSPFLRERTRILFFLYSHVTETNEDTDRSLRRWDLWPLYAKRHYPNGNQRTQILAVLEPFLPNNEAIQRNWSPLWSLWRAEKNPQTGASSQSFLWNLYRRDAMPESRQYSAMFGLFQYKTSRSGKTLRLFHIPLIRPKHPQHTDARP
jgi:hypothetical protein